MFILFLLVLGCLLVHCVLSTARTSQSEPVYLLLRHSNLVVVVVGQPTSNPPQIKFIHTHQKIRNNPLSHRSSRDLPLFLQKIAWMASSSEAWLVARSSSCHVVHGLLQSSSWTRALLFMLDMNAPILSASTMLGSLLHCLEK